MHTAKALTSASFTLTLEGKEASFFDIFPGFDERDRLGVVVRRPGGALAASTLLLAAITAFYDIQRQKNETFFIYPDFYLFHVRQSHGNHSMLDIWPRHKEVVVPDDPEEILRAINDRGITRLLVEDGEPGAPEFERQTRASAERIVTALAYAPSGAADVTVTGNATTESYVAAVLDQSGEIPADVAENIRTVRQAGAVNGAAPESYRRLDLPTALALLVVPGM